MSSPTRAYQAETAPVADTGKYLPVYIFAADRLKLELVGKPQRSYYANPNNWYDLSAVTTTIEKRLKEAKLE